jgi:tRNA(Arg) A34 adenosine deaminase TadA
VSDKHKHYIGILSLLAEDVTPVGGQRIAACIVFKNKIVSFGTNNKRSDPFAVKYQKNPHAIYLHAETSAIKRSLKFLTPKQLRKSTLYICRVSNKDGSWALAAPCLGCRRAIIEYGIKNIVFTVGPEQYDKLINTTVICQTQQKV